MYTRAARLVFWWLVLQLNGILVQPGMGSVGASFEVDRCCKKGRAAQLVYQHERGGSTRYLELFNKKYPFIKVNVRRVGGERLVTIITTEHRAGKTLFDVVISSGVAPSLIKSGIFASISPRNISIFLPARRTTRVTGRILTPIASR